LVALEALASGVPLIATEAGWMTDFLQDCPGYRRFVVEPNVESVVSGLAAVRAGGSDQLLAGARETVSATNSLQVFERRWLELISEVVRGAD
jgi:glycosyltransferase involved in cell wall biosynthesis